MATNLLYLVRHGEADHDSDDPGLTPLGQAQAGRLGARVCLLIPRLLRGTRWATRGVLVVAHSSAMGSSSALRDAHRAPPRDGAGLRDTP